MQGKKIPPILRTLFLIAVSLVVGVNIYSWNAKSLTGNVLPMPFGYGSAVVLSGSMEPTIATGDLIIVKAQDSYALGDVVVYQNENMLVVHRIVEMDAATVTTRGDANNANDTPVALAQVKGRVICHVPQAGKVVRMLKTPAATVLLLLGAVLSIELPYLQEKEKKEEELEQIKAEIRRLREEQEQ